MNRVTLKTIAEQAGVSVVTVSNVLNKRFKKVSQETIELVEKIAAELDYRPNLNAKALATNQSRLVSVLFYSPSNAELFDFSDPFAAELLSGIERVARENNFFVLLFNITCFHDIEELRRNWHFAAHIIVGVNQEFAKEVIARVEETVVFIDTYVAPDIMQKSLPDTIYFVNSEDYSEAYNIMHYFNEANLHRVAFLTYQFDVNEPSVIEQRFKGAQTYVTSLESMAMSLDCYFAEDMQKLIDNVSEYDAIVVTADILAMEFMRESRAVSNMIGNELAVISFDNIKYVKFIDPALTTVDLKQAQKGQVSMRLIVDIIDHHKVVPRCQYIKGELIERQSVRKRESK